MRLPAQAERRIRPGARASSRHSDRRAARVDGAARAPITHVRDAVLYGYLKERVFRFRYSNTWDGRPCTGMGFWAGGYRSKGWLKGEGVLFCNPECATYFAVAAYRDGMRVGRDGTESA